MQNRSLSQCSRFKWRMPRIKRTATRYPSAIVTVGIPAKYDDIFAARKTQTNQPAYETMAKIHLYVMYLDLLRVYRVVRYHYPLIVVVAARHIYYIGIISSVYSDELPGLLFSMFTSLVLRIALPKIFFHCSQESSLRSHFLFF